MIERGGGERDRERAKCSFTALMRERDVYSWLYGERAVSTNPGTWGDIYSISTKPRNAGWYRAESSRARLHKPRRMFFFFFFTLVTGHCRSLSLKLSDIRVYEPQIRARLGTTGRFPSRRLFAEGWCMGWEGQIVLSSRVCGADNCVGETP